ncbi:MAG: HIT domain-containing protein [Candidatus Omnitrophota bacterium]
MTMDKLWAPWRINYIRYAKKKSPCIFCDSQKDFVVFRTPHCVCMLNLYPYNNGHLMVSPKRHIRDIAQLKETEMLDLMKALNKAKGLLDKVLKPDGYNIGANLGRAGGAGITGHLHLHIVPRWVGDSNFMSITGSTRVISQSLKDLYKRLKNAESKTN